LEFRLGLAIRYRLPRGQRIESPSVGFVRDLLRGGSLRFDHLLFTISPMARRPKSNACLQRREPIGGEFNFGSRANASPFDPPMINEPVKRGRGRRDR
jgi:hypothetical protein